MPVAIDGEILTTLLKAFMDVFTLGIARLLPDARWILMTLLTIELAVLGIWRTYGYHQNLAGELAAIGMKTTMYLVLLSYWAPWTKALIKGFTGFGLTASGGFMSETDFTDPSKLATFGISAMTLV